jgi:peptide/nickel transport system permease protein
MIGLGKCKDNWLRRRAKTPESSFHLFASRFVESKLAMCALISCIFMGFIAIFSPWISPQNPYDLSQISISDGRLSPLSKGINGMTYWLGTDDQGRDMLSAIFYGLRISLSVGLISGFAALVLGMVVGLVGAYFGGKLDTFIMRVVDVQLGFPTILIALILLAVLGRGVDKVILALVVSQWARFARIVRSTALVEREKDYMDAAKGLALSRFRIIFHHLMPNCLSPLIVLAMVNVAHAIALEATLSFLGVGLPITEPSLGLLISNGYQYMLSGLYWITFFPGVVLFIIVACLNIVADHLREVLNPRLVL